jgi:hypothetical protein
MASVAFADEMTITPFKRLNVHGAVGNLLSDYEYSVVELSGVDRPKANTAAITPQVVELPDRERFEQAVAQWQHDIQFDSFPEDMKEHDSFAAIVGHGFEVVPLIAAHLRRRPSFLFLALEEIFNEDPVPEEAYGRLDSVSAAWLEWLRN